MNKIFFIIAVLLFIGISTLLISRFVGTEKGVSSSGGVSENTISNFPTVSEEDTLVVTDEIEVLGTGDRSISVPNFLSDPSVRVWNDESYLIAEGTTQTDERAFQIFFSTIDNSLAILLLSEPLGDTRLRAEAVLKDRLQLSKRDICQLFVRVQTPRTVSLEYSGRNLGLSFCDGSVFLPAQRNES